VYASLRRDGDGFCGPSFVQLFASILSPERLFFLYFLVARFSASERIWREEKTPEKFGNFPLCLIHPRRLEQSQAASFAG
jgi:hypothetical protein